MLVGDYYFDEFRIDLVRDEELSDFRTDIHLASEKETFLGFLTIENASLLRLISRLPVDATSEIGFQ